MKELGELFVRRGQASRLFGRQYLRWRTRCGRAAVARSRTAGYATVFYALYRQGRQWLSIERRPDGLPRRYRSAQRAVRAVLRYLRQETGRSGTEQHKAAQGGTKSHAKTHKATRKAHQSASTSVRAAHRRKRRSARAAA